MDIERIDLKPTYASMKAYLEANANGKFGNCTVFYPKCGSYWKGIGNEKCLKKRYGNDRKKNEKSFNE